MKRFATPAVLLAILLAVSAPALAQQGGRGGAQNGQRPNPPAAAAEGSNILSLLPPTTAVRQEITLNGNTLGYIAEAGTIPIRDGNGAITAQVFYTSYFLEQTTARRPITFVFNGGPGAAAAFLNLGAIGPKVLVTTNGEIGPPPSALADNPDSWLDTTDLVFVDPVGTGYSRAADPNNENQFWSTRRDADTMGAFIRLYLQQSGRLLSPIFLAGESYGGFRAVLLATTLQQDIGINPSGLVLISPALEMSLVRGSDFDPLPWALTLPALAASNLELQGITGQAMTDKLKEVEHYAMTDYLAALAAPLPEGAKMASEKVAGYTGLPVDVVERNFGRVSASVFMKERVRSTGQLLSRYDGTVGAPDPNPASPGPRGPDPILDRSIPAWTSAFVSYLRDVIGFRTDITYRLLNREIANRWDYGSRQGFAGVMDDLANARSHNPKMQVLIAQGYTDLVTPYPSAAYLVGQMAPMPGAAPVEIRLYEGGHMMYIRPDSRKALKQDAAELYRRAAAPSESEGAPRG